MAPINVIIPQPFGLTPGDLDIVKELRLPDGRRLRILKWTSTVESGSARYAKVLIEGILDRPHDAEETRS